MMKVTEQSLLDQMRIHDREIEWLHALGERYHWDPMLLGNLDLCINEALTNIIDYGYDDSENKASSTPRWIRVRITLRGTQVEMQIVEMQIEDDAKPFDPLAYTLAELATDLATAPVGGLGIRLIRNLMAECTYQRRDNKNILTLVARPADP
jgi:anti-sigma regulatory factor (Ser/Thr protein kinase)